MNNQSFFKQIFFVLFISFFISCDSDSNEIGTNIIGDDNFVTEKLNLPVDAFTKSYGDVESTNLPINLLGVYNNPVFGKTTANFATQVQLATLNPTINAELDPTIIDVTLSIPYFSKTTGTDADDNITYSLDSIFGTKNAKLNLKVYRSRTYMGAVETKFYNTSNSLFENMVTENDLLGEAATFEFSPKYVVDYSYDESTNAEVKTNVAPRLNMLLKSEKFQEIFTTAAANGSLLNNTVFKEYFRGLYFKVAQGDSDPQGVMGLLNFAGGKITIRYKEKIEKDEPATTNKTLVLNLTGNTVNLIDKTSAHTIPDADKKLVLESSGAGSLAVIDLFPDANVLADLKAQKLLVNNATLTFYVDSETMGATAIEPERILLYDLTTNNPIIDYYSDSYVNSTYTNLSKRTYGGIIEKIEVGTLKRGFKYKFNLTNHITRLLATADTYKNVKLGVVITKNINVVTTTSLLKQDFNLSPELTVKSIPSMSIISPASTILWGSGTNVSEEKRLKLEIHYTKPN